MDRCQGHGHSVSGSDSRTQFMKRSNHARSGDLIGEALPIPRMGLQAQVLRRAPMSSFDLDRCPRMPSDRIQTLNRYDGACDSAIHPVYALQHMFFDPVFPTIAYFKRSSLLTGLLVDQLLSLAENKRSRTVAHRRLCMPSGTERVRRQQIPRVDPAEVA